MTGSPLAMSKQWIPLTAENIGAVPAQLGVFEIGDAAEAIIKIGFAGGHELFGLRSALDGAQAEPVDGTAGSFFRYEVTHGYLTRWEELLMVHQAMHGHLPAGNADHQQKIGRLTLDAPRR